MADVLCLGEILVDWICRTVGAELNEAESFTKAPGGAPANTAVGLARQGISTGFIGRVSDDDFGAWLVSILQDNGIDTRGTIRDPNAQTRMAYVVTTLSGDRKLAEFTRVACADAQLTVSDIIPEQFENAHVLHFGSISLIANPSADATRHAVHLAQEHNLLISYDPNVRTGLWPSADICRTTILDTLNWADLVKINEDELFFLTGSHDISAAETLRAEHNIPLLIITLDARGAYITTPHGHRIVPGFGVHLEEATGAGDGFNSGVIAGLLPYLKKSTQTPRKTLEALDLNQLQEIVYRANAIGAITCTRAGAMPALPTTQEVDFFMRQYEQPSYTAARL
jgi:fructokinase